MKISYSEIDTFNQCRQRWHYTYRQGLQPKEQAEPLTIGSAGHAALEAFYKGQDWHKALENWKDANTVAQIESPPVLPQSEEEDEFYFESTVNDLGATVSLVEQIIERYILKWGEIDRTWEILEVEKRFEIEILPGVTLVGVWDLILRDRDGNIWIMDHKFPGSTFRDFTSLELDAQIGIYQWAAQKMGYNALGFIYNQIKAKVPQTPKILAKPRKSPFGGQISIAEIDTDWDTYSAFVVMNGEHHLLSDYEQEMVPKLNKRQFFDRSYLYRSPVEIGNFHDQMTARVSDFERGQDTIFMVPQKFNCQWCAFKGLCVETLKGQDISEMILNDFNVKERKVEEDLKK